jgi:GrpB-like predicted nucleotidyltransferase (UPF0157 family)
MELIAVSSRAVLTPYSAEWPKVFAHEHELIVRAFAPIGVRVEHSGSTAVPQLAAKPVIDILLGAPSLAAIELRIDELRAIGYDYISRYEQQLPLRRYFVKSSASSNRVHLHAVQTGSRFWQEQLAFRDILRSDPQLRASYERLKLDLAADPALDKAAYTEAKGPFIQSALARWFGAMEPGS